MAIKRIAQFDTYDYNLVKVAREVMIMRAFKQMADERKVPTYSPMLFDMFLGNGSNLSLFIVMEQTSYDLKHVIKLAKSTGMTEDHVRVIAYNILCALKFQHSANIIHRDIKPANILIN